MENTIVDVIEGYFGETPNPGDVKKLTLNQIEDFKDRVIEFCDSQGPVNFDENEKPVYIGGFESYWPGVPELFKSLSLSLLYQPRLLVHDPLGEYFGLNSINDLPEMKKIKSKLPSGAQSIGSRGPRNWALNYSYIGEKASGKNVYDSVDTRIQSIIKMKPLLRSGALIARSQWGVIHEYSNEILASSRNDVNNRMMIEFVQETQRSGGSITAWDNIRGLRVSVPGAKVSHSNEIWSWQPEFYYLAKSIKFADYAGSVYVPNNSEDYGLLKTKIESNFVNRDKYYEASKNRVSGRREEILNLVVQKLIPNFEIDPSTAVAIRESEEAFEDWRLFIRDLQRESQGLNEGEIQELVDDRVTPILDNINKRISASAILKHSKQGMVNAGIFAIPTFVPIFMMQDFDASNLSANIIGTVSSGILGTIQSMYMETKYSDNKYRVFSKLMNAS